MGFKHGFLFGIGALFALAAICIIIGNTTAQYAATNADPSSYNGTITVTGSGSVYADPDMAQVSIGVTNEATTAAQAMSDNAAAMTRVIDALKRQGIAQADIKTSTVSLQPKYSYQYPKAYYTGSSGVAGPMIPAASTTSAIAPMPTSAPTVLTTEIVGYTATNTVTVTVRDLTKVGAAIDAGYNNGANQVNGVTFMLSDDKANSVYQQALQSAITNGASKAQTMATAAGVGSIKLKTISESGIYYPMTFQAFSADAAGAVSTPISPGQNKVTATVSLTYVYPLQ